MKNTKNFLTSKVNWLFGLSALLATPEARELIGNNYSLTVQIVSFLGVIARTFFTSKNLNFKI